MNLFITGGAGFIGSAVVRFLINRTNHTVVNIDKLTYAGNLSSLDSISSASRYHFIKADICNQSAIKAAFEKYQPDAIMHLAAESHVDRSIDGPADFIQTNIVGTFTLLETAREYWQRLSMDKKESFRFHHISTDEVFGDLNDLDAEKFTERTPYNPSSPYSASKASSDHLVRAWFRTYGLPVIVTNCSNNYGPYHFPEKLIPLMILNALEGQPLPVYGKGDQIRDWLYVDDHARALYKVITEGRVGETYNIGGRNEKKNLEVVTTICQLLDNLVAKKPKGISHFNELITFVEDRPGHDNHYAIDTEKTEKELNWKPEETFASGMEKTVKWVLENKNWYSSVLKGKLEKKRLGRSIQ